MPCAVIVVGDDVDDNIDEFLACVAMMYFVCIVGSE